MTNKILFIANWKMFGTKKTVKTINTVIKFSKKTHNKKAKIIYCPPYTLIDSIVKKTKNGENILKVLKEEGFTSPSFSSGINIFCGRAL